MAYPNKRVSVEDDLPFAFSTPGSPLMLVFDEDESYQEESEWEETQDNESPDGMLF